MCVHVCVCNEQKLRKYSQTFIVQHKEYKASDMSVQPIAAFPPHDRDTSTRLFRGQMRTEEGGDMGTFLSSVPVVQFLFLLSVLNSFFSESVWTDQSLSQPLICSLYCLEEW